MKKKLAALAAAGALLLAAVPVLAGKPPDVPKGPAPKVDVCHISDYYDIPNPFSTVIGHWINVSENALAAHQAHGDFAGNLTTNDIDYGPVLFGLTWRQIAENNGLDTSDAECAGFVLDF